MIGVPSMGHPMIEYFRVDWTVCSDNTVPPGPPPGPARGQLWIQGLSENYPSPGGGQGPVQYTTWDILVPGYYHSSRNPDPLTPIRGQIEYRRVARQRGNGSIGPTTPKFSDDSRISGTAHHSCTISHCGAPMSTGPGESEETSGGETPPGAAFKFAEFFTTGLTLGRKCRQVSASQGRFRGGSNIKPGRVHMS